MSAVQDLWSWLLNLETQKTLTFLGGGLGAAVAALWALYKFRVKAREAKKLTPGSGISADRDIIAGRDIINIQTTPEQLDAFLKKRLKEVMAELPTVEAERRAVLLKELDAIRVKNENIEKALEEQQVKLAEAYKALDDFKNDFAPDQVKEAQKALARGETGNAEALFQKALDQSTAQAAEAAYHLGVLAESRIDYLKAKEYCAKAVQLQPDNPQYLSGLGKLQTTLGQYQEAQPNLERAFQIREKTLGPDHPSTGASLTNLAVLYYVQWKHAEAEPLLQRALKIEEKALGPEHPDVAASLNNLASLYQSEGKSAEAEQLYQRALKIGEKALGPEHPNVATGLSNIAELYRIQGKYVEAEQLSQRALKIKEKALGPEHPDVATCLNRLALIYDNQMKYAEAEPLYQQALKIREKALGPDNPDVAQPQQSGRAVPGQGEVWRGRAPLSAGS
jgi:tetratricopeptide (TPR) repeat protein